MRQVDPRVFPRPTEVVRRWVARRTVATNLVPPTALLCGLKCATGLRISAVVIVSDRSRDVDRICGTIRRDLMEDVRLVDEVVVVAAPTADGYEKRVSTPAARVVDVRDLLPEVPEHPGRGDSRWRSLAELTGDIVAWIDADAHGFESHVVTRLVAPLLVDPAIGFVKGFHESPEEFRVEIDDVLYLAGGRRMTELLARPLINLFFPELGGFVQPLDGPCAGRMDVLRQVPFFSDCSVDVGLLIDVLDAIGLDAMVQVNLGPICEDDRPLDELGPAAHAIARTILKRAQERGRVKLPPSASMHPFLVPRGRAVEAVRIDEVERPPMEVVPPYLEALRSGDRSVSRVRLPFQGDRARPADVLPFAARGGYADPAAEADHDECANIAGERSAERAGADR